MTYAFRLGREDESPVSILRCLYNLFVLFLLLLFLLFFLFINLSSFKGAKKKELDNKTLLLLKSKPQNTLKVPFLKN